MASVIDTKGTTATLTGTAGNVHDYLYGTAGDDIISGGSAATADGFDTMVGGAGDDQYFVNNTQDVVIEAIGEGSNDTIFTSVAYTLPKEVENIVAQGNTLAGITITGNDLGNKLEGRAAFVDNLVGMGGNDVYYITATGLADTIVEGNAKGTATTYSDTGGIDTIIAEGQSVAINKLITTATQKTTGADQIKGQAYIENVVLVDGTTADFDITGNIKDNRLVGNNGINNILGDKGNDTLDGGSAGADVLKGGAGNDTYIVNHSGVTVSETLAGSAGTDTVLLNGTGFTFTMDTDNKVENLTIMGTAGSMIATGNGLANKMTGSSAADTVNGLLGKDIIKGMQGADKIDGGGDNDALLDGGEGADTVRGGLGADKMVGDSSAFWKAATTFGVGNGTVNTPDFVVASGATAGDPTLESVSGNDVLTGDAGNDTMDGGYGDDSLSGGDDNDVMVGSWGADVMHGDIGNDNIDGGYGNDSLEGGAGNDKVYGDSGKTNDELMFDGTNAVNGQADNLSGGGGNDSLYGGIGDDIVDGGTDNDLLDGGNGANTLNGGTGDDKITAGDGADVIDGGAGNDTINSGAGANIINTEAGNDIVTGGSEVDQIDTGDGNDAITAGAGADIIRAGAGKDVVLTGDDADTIYFGAAAFAASNVAGTADTTFIPEVTAAAATGSGNTLTTSLATSFTTPDTVIAPTAADAQDDSSLSIMDWYKDLVFDGTAASDELRLSTLTAVKVKGTVIASTLTESALNTALSVASLGFDNVAAEVTAAIVTIGSKNYLAVDLDATNTFTEAGDFIIEVTGSTTSGLVDASFV